MLRLWPLLRVDDLDRSFPQWLAAALPLIQNRNERSARLAQNYLLTFRAVETGLLVPITLPAPRQLADDAVRSSLVVTGPAAVKAKITRGLPAAKAMQEAAAESARSAMRHSMSGGREAILDAVEADPRASGRFFRATGGKACAFCAMLASRGPVYRSDDESSAGFQAHDSCGCVPEPHYRDDAEWPPGSREYRELWDRTTKDSGGGQKAINAFRRALAGGDAA